MTNFGLNNKHYSTISRYVIACALAIAAIALVAVHFLDILAILKNFLTWIYGIIAPLIIGGFIAILLYPLVTRIDSFLQKFEPCKKHRSSSHVLAVVLVAILVVIIIMILVALLLSVITGSIQRIRPENLEALYTYVLKNIDALYRWLLTTAEALGIHKDELNALAKTLSSFYIGGAGIEETVSRGMNAVRHGATTTVFASIFAIYFMVDAPNVSAYWRRVVPQLLGEANYQRFSTFKSDLVFAFSAYMRGQVLDALLMGFMVSVALSLIKVEFAPVIGIATGIGNLIPYVGPLVSYALTLIVCLVNGEFTKLLIAALLLLIIQFIDGQIINPKILSDSVEVHPILVLIALTAGAKLGGIVGMFIAVPVAALIKIYFERYIASKQKTKDEMDLPADHTQQQ